MFICKMAKQPETIISLVVILAYWPTAWFMLLTKGLCTARPQLYVFSLFR